VSVVEGIKHNDFSMEKFNITLNELRAERDSVKELGLI
jgi:malate dehydrogenase